MATQPLNSDLIPLRDCLSGKTADEFSRTLPVVLSDRLYYTYIGETEWTYRMSKIAQLTMICLILEAESEGA